MSSKTNWWHINMEMIFVKIGFILYGAEKSSYAPYSTIFLSSIAFTLEEVGVVVAAQKAGMIFGSLFWSMLADKTQARRTIVFMFCILFSLFNTSQPLLSGWLGPKMYNRCPTTVARYNLTLIPLNVSRDTGLWPWSKIFYFITLANFMAGFSNQFNLFLEEVTVYKIKQSTGNPQYGRQFMFGTFGFAIAATLSGQFVKTFPKAPVSCYTGIFLFSIAIAVFQTAVMQHLFKTTINEKHYHDNPSVASNYLHDLCPVLKDADLIMHYVTALVAGFLHEVYMSYFFKFLKSVLDAPHILIGMTIASGSVSGFFVSFLSSWIIKITGGVWNAYAIAMCLFGVRSLLFSYLQNPWLTIPIQLLLNGTSLTLFFIGNVEYLKRKNNVPMYMRTTLFGIQSCLFSGVGPIMGGVFGGHIYHVHGARYLFLLMAAVSWVWAVLIVISGFFLRKPKNYAEIKEIESEQEYLELLRSTAEIKN